MALINRIQRLLRADIHAILDTVEEPEAVLKQAIREMQEALDVKRACWDRRQRILAALAAHEQSLQCDLEKAEEDLRLSLDEAGEELARKTLARKLALKKRLKSAQARAAALTETCRQQEQEIAAQQAHLDGVIEKARGFVQITPEDSPAAVADSILGFHGATGSRPGEVPADELELEWLRLKRERGGRS